MIEQFTVVHFRREKTYLECQAEVEAGQAKGIKVDPQKVNRWKFMGETLMVDVPQQDRFIFINGIQYRVADVSWSLHLSELPGQPNFDNPQVMITLRQESPPSGLLTPETDFFK